MGLSNTQITKIYVCPLQIENVGTVIEATFMENRPKIVSFPRNRRQNFMFI